jgi:dipeptidase D
VSGLQGGHSGLDINKGRGNAIAILGRTLLVVMDRLPGGTGVATIKGGSKRNAIPREASATVLVEIGREEDLRRLAAEVEAEILSALGSFDPGVSIAVESAPYPGRVFARSGAHQVVGLLASLPHGVLEMSPDVPGLVQTSTNLAIVSAGDGDVEIETSQRSSIESSKLAAGRMVSTILQFAGFEARPAGGYPGWKPEPSSDIVRRAQKVHLEILGTTPELVAMHAGLECGVIGEKHPGMQMISFGPHIVDVHSPSERLKISSVEPFWRFLKGLLESL